MAKETRSRDQSIVADEYKSPNLQNACFLDTISTPTVFLSNAFVWDLVSVIDNGCRVWSVV